MDVGSHLPECLALIVVPSWVGAHQRRAESVVARGGLLFRQTRSWSARPRTRLLHRPPGSAARRLSAGGGRRDRRSARHDRRYLPGVPARRMSVLSEKDNPRRLQVARLDRAHVPPAVECFAGEENRSTINSLKHSPAPRAVQGSRTNIRPGHGAPPGLLALFHAESQTFSNVLIDAFHSVW